MKSVERFSTVGLGPSFHGDVNRDGAVKDIDAALLAANWQSGTTASYIPDDRISEEDRRVLEETSAELVIVAGQEEL